MAPIRGPNATGPGHEDPAPEQITASTKRLNHRDGSSPLAELVKGPRPWSHRAQDCNTCQLFTLVSDRRRRAEVASLKRAQRIVDLRSEEDAAWVQAHAYAHGEQERSR